MRTVLLVDDDPVQLKLNVARLQDAGFGVETAGSADEALDKARRSPPGAIVSDVLMGEVDGFALCRRVREDARLDSVPVILLSAHYAGADNREFAARIGASALVSRTPEFTDELAALHASLAAGRPAGTGAGAVVLYEEHLRANSNQIVRLLEQARSAEKRYRSLFENASSAIGIVSAEGMILEANEGWREIAGFAPEEMVGRHISAFAAPGHERMNNEIFQRVVASGARHTGAVALRRADGGTLYMEFTFKALDLDGQQVILNIGHDVTERVAAERRLAAAEEKYRSLVERLPDVVWTTDMAGKVVFMTPNCLPVLGFTSDEMYGEDLARCAQSIHPDDQAAVQRAFAGWLAGGAPMDVEYRRRRRDGTWVWLRNRGTAMYQSYGQRYCDGTITDVTEKRRLDDIVQQAQKMEAIGQLSGGIAHDFNNILAAILANSHFLIDALAEHDPRREDAEEIRLGAERAASLTRQLLAFSRRQVLEPKVVDLNSTVAALERMLRRLIGEDIELTVVAGAELGAVRVDVGQIEQVIMNLAVNARDTMPTGGRLSIETCNVELDDAALATAMGTPPGSYVMLAVSDTGCGMDAETRRRIFEPFFTTKEIGKGTGLGLSTCYGIVKQSGGTIWVYSEPGRGSVFKVYLPRVDQRPAAVSRRAPGLAVDGSETVLVVEDDARVRAAVTRILEAHGYRVLVAHDGEDALVKVASHAGAIDLILSDVVMPRRSGPEIVNEIQKRHARARALFMSGYTDHAVLKNGVLDAGVSFIQKPFTPEALVKKAREVLDG